MMRGKMENFPLFALCCTMCEHPPWQQLFPFVALRYTDVTLRDALHHASCVDEGGLGLASEGNPPPFVELRYSCQTRGCERVFSLIFPPQSVHGPKFHVATKIQTLKNGNEKSIPCQITYKAFISSHKGKTETLDPLIACRLSHE